jgi:hypothetical protein
MLFFNEIVIFHGKIPRIPTDTLKSIADLVIESAAWGNLSRGLRDGRISLYQQSSIG